MPWPGGTHKSETEKHWRRNAGLWYGAIVNLTRLAHEQSQRFMCAKFRRDLKRKGAGFEIHWTWPLRLHARGLHTPYYLLLYGSGAPDLQSSEAHDLFLLVKPRDTDSGPHAVSCLFYLWNRNEEGKEKRGRGESNLYSLIPWCWSKQRVQRKDLNAQFNCSSFK